MLSAKPHKVTIHTQVVGFEERWIYIAQSMWVKGEPTSAVLLRTGVTGNGRVIPVDEILLGMNVDHWIPEMPEWVKAWSTSDQLRPWPPLP